MEKAVTGSSAAERGSSSKVLWGQDRAAECRRKLTAGLGNSVHGYGRTACAAEAPLELKMRGALLSHLHQRQDDEH
eukprot:5648220-Pleurochrysis_carterae.AAC.1